MRATPSAAIPAARQALSGAFPSRTSRQAKYGPSASGSQEMPTIAPPPPGAALKNSADQP